MISKYGRCALLQTYNIFNQPWTMLKLMSHQLDIQTPPTGCIFVVKLILSYEQKCKGRSKFLKN